MEDVIIIAAIGLGAWWLLKKSGVLVPTQTPRIGVPTSQGLATPTSVSGGALISGGYQTAPLSAAFGFGSPSSGASLPTVPAPPPAPPPPPAFWGGIAGSVGSGGNPLGGVLRAGVSMGTGTTTPTATIRDFTSGPRVAGAAPALRPGTSLTHLTAPVVIA